MVFAEALKKGRRKVTILGLFKRPSGALLSLAELLGWVRATGESYGGIQEVPVDKIVGSENRSRDFAEGFLPIHRGMQDRWDRVKAPFLAGEIAEAVELIEYGGLYFVRDGNHRVSLAKTHGIAFITARVQSLKVPVKLPQPMTRKQIPLFVAKARFQDETKVFLDIPEDDFHVSVPENWDFLKKDILENGPNWYRRNHRPVPDWNTHITHWNKNIYQTALEYIRRHSLPLLFPHKQETDIFCDLLRLWNSYPDLDELWLVEVYDLYLKKALQRRLWMRPWRFVRQAWGDLFVTTLQARESFLSLSNFRRFVPDGEVPHGTKRWYRFLSDHWLVWFCRELKEWGEKRKGDRLMIDEVVKHGWDLFLKPAFDEYRALAPAAPFHSLFMAWTKHRGWQLVREGEPSAERTGLSFREFVRSRRERTAVRVV